MRGKCQHLHKRVLHLEQENHELYKYFRRQIDKLYRVKEQVSPSSECTTVWCEIIFHIRNNNKNSTAPPVDYRGNMIDNFVALEVKSSVIFRFYDKLG